MTEEERKAIYSAKARNAHDITLRLCTLFFTGRRDEALAAFLGLSLPDKLIFFSYLGRAAAINDPEKGGGLDEQEAWALQSFLINQIDPI